MNTDQSPTPTNLMKRLQTPNALNWGGTFVGYDSPDELEAVALIRTGEARITQLLPFGFKIRLTSPKREEVQP
jgi:hypothetical protein